MEGFTVLLPAVAYDGFDEEMSIDAVRELEARDDYGRHLIGNVLFKEKWYMNPVDMSIHKTVSEIQFAYEKYDTDANVIGYTAAIKINLDKFKILAASN